MHYGAEDNRKGRVKKMEETIGINLDEYRSEISSAQNAASAIEINTEKMDYYTHQLDELASLQRNVRALTRRYQALLQNDLTKMNRAGMNISATDRQLSQMMSNMVTGGTTD